MSYEQVAHISQTAALVLFFAVFVVIAVYAFWPGNKAFFERAARLPLDKDPDQGGRD